MPEEEHLNLPECNTGECLPTEQEIRERFNYVKGISSKTGGKVFHVVEAQNGYFAFVEINGKFYATSGYPTLDDLEGYVF